MGLIVLVNARGYSRRGRGAAYERDEIGGARRSTLSPECERHLPSMIHPVQDDVQEDVIHARLEVITCAVRVMNLARENIGSRMLEE
jgi:hypothetical protein